MAPRPALMRSTDVDVAILGGGYTGLWTAYYLLCADPALKVAVVEKEIVGYGASGRNGGWCSSKFPVTPSMLEQRYGHEAARNLMLAMNDSVDEVARVCESEEIDAHFHKGGILTLARGEHHVPMLRSAFDSYARLGLAQQYDLLSAAQVRERVRVTNVHGGLYAAENASLHPGRLVRGIARAIEKRGGTVYEKTEVVGFEGGSAPRLVTPAGEIRAKRAVVLAGESYLTRLPALHRVVLPVYSLIVLTEPLSDQQWSEIGWQNRESLASCNYTVDYLTRTADGRILFGSRGAPYRFGSKISDDQDRHAETHAHIKELVAEWFPVLKGIHFTHEWGGSVGHAPRLDAHGGVRSRQQDRDRARLHRPGRLHNEPRRKNPRATDRRAPYMNCASWRWLSAILLSGKWNRFAGSLCAICRTPSGELTKQESAGGPCRWTQPWRDTWDGTNQYLPGTFSSASSIRAQTSLCAADPAPHHLQSGFHRSQPATGKLAETCQTVFGRND